MAGLDMENLLGEISPENPCGESLEYDQVYQEMERAARGREAQQMGDSVIEGEEPDWKEVKAKALDLLARTRDIWVVIYLARSLLHTEGFPGFESAMALLLGCLDRHWDHVHPQLDPEDAVPADSRVIKIKTLASRDGLLGDLREATLVSARGFGTFSLRHMEQSDGRSSVPEGEEAPEAAAIDGAFMECELESLQASAAAVTASLGHVQKIDALLTEKVGASQSADLSDLTSQLTEISRILADRLVRRGVADPDADAEGGEAGVSAAAGLPAASGEIRSREDVIRVLDRACEYFQRYEPSSPVPLLLNRAKRLVTRNFMEIMQDLAPDAISQVETVSGTRTEE
ncbi:MAG: type VI secretion system protein TssA [Acidobacteria bacterium]|nr:MAG: type VI secretion system protein TssA [Acidobacteriota bacterium]